MTAESAFECSGAIIPLLGYVVDFVPYPLPRDPGHCPSVMFPPWLAVSYPFGQSHNGWQQQHEHEAHWLATTEYPLRK